MRHQRIHQKARHGKPHGKDSDKDERAEEDSEGESTHSCEQEAEVGHVAFTRSRREGPAGASATKDCGRCEEKAGAGRAPREQASAGDPSLESPAALVQDLLELCAKRPARPVLAADSASQLLGLE